MQVVNMRAEELVDWEVLCDRLAVGMQVVSMRAERS